MSWLVGKLLGKCGCSQVAPVEEPEVEETEQVEARREQENNGLNGRLQNWCNEIPRTDGEYERRCLAVERIKHCYSSRSTMLNLTNYQLTSLPREIGNLENLQRLILRGNRLISLPAEVGNLENLQSLELMGNQLSLLPAEVGNLQNLQTLDLWGNRLVTLPREIGNLENLRVLILQGNRLDSLPTEVGNLENLERLILVGNQLTGLPLEVLGLSDNCTIDVTGCPFSTAVLERLRARVLEPNYEGPQIHHSIVEARNVGIPNLSLDELLNDLYTVVSKERPDLNFLINHEKSGDLRIWLGKLSYVAEFRKGGEEKRRLALKVIEYLELAQKDSKFRDLFFPIIEEASTTCGDRMALSVIHLGIQKKLSTCDLTNTKELANLLIHGVWAMDQLEKIAREKIPTMGLVDEIEVYLGYLIQLRERLQIPLDVTEMLYFRCSNLSRADLNSAGSQVSAKLQSDERYQFLATQEIWRKALEKSDPTAYQESSISGNPMASLIELTKKTLGSSS